MKKLLRLIALTVALLCGAAANAGDNVKQVLFVGDSMTGWLADRLNAYGQVNGFNVVAQTWDGSTIKKWANSPLLGELIAKYKPDVVFISLGLNELLEPNPAKRLGPSLEKIKHALGNVPYIWIGPPTWPRKKGGNILNDWLAQNLAPGHYFNSFSLTLPRQSATNPHPTRDGMIKWIDAVMQWMPDHATVQLPGYTNPGKGKMARPKVFLHKRMKS